MFSRTGFFRTGLCLLLTAVLAVGAFADTIRLKNGSMIKGKITKFSGGKFTVEVGEGPRRREMTFAASEIESVVFEEKPSAPQLSSSSRNNNAAKPPAAATPTTQQPTKVVLTGANDRPPTPPRTTTAAKPIEWQIRVTADSTANGWTNTGWVVRKGQRIRITGDGRVSLGRGNMATPAGLPNVRDDQKLLPNAPTGALIAVIGDDNNDFIFIGSSREFTATRDGALFLGINEGNLDDNSGVFNVKVEIFP
ncbi:MAG: hypothetical protein IPM50_05340 [Acidobacteriota bacterium]|nr:MAG: hypothetical protein IPM50_05340 [Acidobacteriota bacterium]